MARYNILPVGAGSSRWKIERNGTLIKRHNTQGAAIKKARKKASSGDTIVIHGRDGTIRENNTVR